MESDDWLKEFCDSELPNILNSYNNQNNLFNESPEPSTDFQFLDLGGGAPTESFKIFDLNEIAGEIFNYENNLSNQDDHFLINLNNSKFPLGQFGGNDDEEFQIIRETSRKNLKFNCSETIIDFKIHDKQYENFTQAVESCQRFIGQIHKKYIESTYHGNFIRLAIINQDFSPINIGFTKASSVSPKFIFDHLDKVVQSRKKLLESEKQSLYNIQMSIMIANVLRGGSIPVRKSSNESEINKSRGVSKSNQVGKRLQKNGEKRQSRVKPRKPLSSRDFFCKNPQNMSQYMNSKSILKVFNKDNLCLIHAVLIAIYYDKNEGKNLLRPGNKRIAKEAVQLASLLNIPNRMCGIQELKKLENHFNYQIMVIDENYHKTKNPIYLNNNIKSNNCIYLSLFKEHYYIIRSMKIYFNKKFYCNLCKYAFNNLGWHKCENVCKSCSRLDCQKEFEFECNICKIPARNYNCIDIHNEKRCKILRSCSVCGYYKHPHRVHICGDNNKYCKNCRCSVELNHKCFMLTEDQYELRNKNKIKEKFNGYVFFDFETYVDNQSSEHVVNLAMAQKICNQCLDLKVNERCDECTKIHVFYNISDYCDWCLDQHHTVHIAHNMQGYDGLFMLKHFIESNIPSDKPVNAIRNGNKLLAIMFRTIKIIDSYSFINMALAEFPKTFGIHELKKGFFPHIFNTPENQNFISDNYPAKEYYQSGFFKKSKKDEFDAWYERVKHTKFDFKQEFHDYCESDVRLLTEGCLNFRKNFMKSTKKDENDKGVDPFLKSITIASACNLVWRRNFMKPNTIAIIPENGYHPEQKSSNKAMLWLKYMAMKNNSNIQQSRSIDGEVRCGRKFLDGVDYENKIIYEFHGCYYHGCPDCFLGTTFNNTFLVHQFVLYGRHCDRIEFIKKSMPEFKLVEIWEHEWELLRKEDPMVNEYLSNEDPIALEAFNPRDALFGGRTEASCLYKNCEYNEKISYIDICSLYPYWQKYGIYPIGHSEIIVHNFDYKKQYFGLIKCKILPPRKLFFPVLPARINSKLMFSLCFTCSALNQSTCNHSDEQRAIYGTWCSLEVDEAIRQGYKLIKYYQVWHWEIKDQYNKESKTGGLFTGYINQALKEKQEASGFPAECITEEQKDKYISDYYDHEGIRLDKAQIEFNPGKRAVAKIKANSQWGFLAMNSNKVSYKVINNAYEWYQLLENQQYKIHDAQFFGENCETLQVWVSQNKEYFEGSIKTNVVLAAFVTCQARLHLFSELIKIQKRVLYFDTDSIIYVSKPGEYNPRLGCYLGDFTNEVAEGNYIQEFVSAGPKNYAYKYDNGITHCTIKGFTQNYLTSLKITFESIKHIVCQNQKEKTTVEQLKFVKDKKNLSIKTKIEQKNYGFVYDKRVLFEDLTTLPFGY